MMFQALYDSMSYSFPRCLHKVYKIKKRTLTLQQASIRKRNDRIPWLPCGYVTSFAMMEKKAFSSSRLRVFSFLMYSATASIILLWIIIDVYYAFFFPVLRCSRCRFLKYGRQAILKIAKPNHVIKNIYNSSWFIVKMSSLTAKYNFKTYYLL